MIIRRKYNPGFFSDEEDFKDANEELEEDSESEQEVEKEEDEDYSDIPRGKMPGHEESEEEDDALELMEW